MRCVMTYGIYLRADGRLPCYCGAGENITLARYTPNKGMDFVHDFFNKGLFAHIRNAQSKDMTPFPGICEQCSYLEPETPFVVENKMIRWFHLEPSMRCMLNCEWCKGQRKNPATLSTLDLNMVTEITDSFARAGYQLDKGNICGVGEPTLHPDLWQMVKYIKDRLGGNILISTNGNGAYSEDIVTSGIDKIKIAIDSTRQEQYQRYRENGSINKVYEFTEKIAQAKKTLALKVPKIIWQYIMFNFNDSDQELLELQKKARQMDVDSLRIVYTRCNNYSQKKCEEFPKTFDNIDFFQIKDESLLSKNVAHKRLNQAESYLQQGELKLASLQYIRLVNDITKRLLLGVKTYADFLNAVYNMKNQIYMGTPSLSAQDAQDMQQFMEKSFAHLSEIYESMGEKRQAQGYRNFMKKAGIPIK